MRLPGFLPPFGVTNLLLLLGGLGALDLATTFIGLALGLTEANPMGEAMLGPGFVLLIAAKILVLALVAWAALAMNRRGYTGYAKWGIINGILVWGFAVIWNTIHIIELL